MRGSHNTELACLRKEERKKNILSFLRVPSLVLLQCFLAPLGVFLVTKTLKDEWYIVVEAYKLTVFEIWRDLFVLLHIACQPYPHIRSTDSMISTSFNSQYFLLYSLSSY